jgi:two-component system C4-dicarboxylate transport response regulator DctD
MGRVLIIDDDPAVRDALAQTLELADRAVLAAGSFVEAKDHITRGFDGIILSDVRMPGRDGFYVLDYVHSVDPELPIIILTGEGDIPMAVRAVGRGAFDFLEKPCGADVLLPVIDRALTTRRLVLENRRLKEQLDKSDPAARLIFGDSSAAETLRRHVRSAAALQTDVLVCGAAGTGISKVAEVIHLSSNQSKGPFVKRSADGLERSDLMASIAACQGGTLFLDAIDAMPPDTQIALQDKMESADLMPRIIAGTNTPVAMLEQDGRLMVDLFYRLNAVTVRIPSLSERPEDIPILFRHYVAQAAEQSGVTSPDVSADYLAALMARDWPGNARALMSVAMRFVLGVDQTSEAHDLDSPSLADQIARVEKSILVTTLRKCDGRVSEVIKILKLPRKTFYDKLAKHGIRAELFR